MVKSKDSCGVTACIREPHKHNEIKLDCIIHTKLREHKAITDLKLQIWECINIYNTHTVYIYCIHKLNCFCSATYIHTVDLHHRGNCKKFHSMLIRLQSAKKNTNQIYICVLTSNGLLHNTKQK